MKRTKVLLFANTDWYLYNFRLLLAQQLLKEDFDVVLVSPMGKYAERFSSFGLRWVRFDFDTFSVNPIKELSTILRLCFLFWRERPSLVHTFTIKCNIYGGLAAHVCGQIPVVNALTGLGHVFTSEKRKAKLLRPIVRKLQKYVLGNSRNRTIFQNEDDKQSFINSGIINESNATVIRGSGVDCLRFQSQIKVPNEKKKTPSVLFASRMLKEKGVYELVEAIRVLKSKGIEFEMHFAGDICTGNPSSLSEKEKDEFLKDGFINYHGHVDNIYPLLDSSDIVVLPSYREGTPRILIEAAAMGKPIVTSNIPGCRGLVRHGVNGLLVPVRNASELAKALEDLLLMPSEKRLEFGRTGRQIVLEEFCDCKVNSRTLDVYTELLSPSGRIAVTPATQFS